MSSSFFVGILAVAVCGSYLLEGSSATTVAITTGNHYATNSFAVNITCLPGDKESDIRDPIIVTIKGPGNKVLATLSKDQNIVFGDNIPSRYQASGTISLARLTLTINEPQQMDFGDYTCRLTYLNSFEQLVISEGMGTFHEDNITSIISKQIDRLFNRVSSLETTVKELSRKESTKSAFFATTNNHLVVEIGKKIAFPEVKMTHGLQGYDKSTGIYTAPADGLYVFHLLISLNCNNCHIIGYLMVNDARVAGFGVHDKIYYDQTSIPATVTLKKGDLVYAVPNSKDSKSKVGYKGFSSFSGVLLEAF